MESCAIRKLRQRLGESQAQFGKRFDVSQITVAYWESGRSQPARRRLDELAALASSATPATPAMPPFRPIQYLGSKQRLAETIAAVIEDVAPGRSRVGDLFAGSGVVSALLGAKRSITAVDIQAYSNVLSTALLLGRAEHYLPLIGSEFRAQTEEVARRVARRLKPLLTFEQEAISAAAEGKPELLTELIEFGSMAVHVQRRSTGAPPRLAMMLSAAADELDRSGFSAADLSATRYFGGPYFSYQQAIALDAIHVVARQQPNIEVVSGALAVLLSVASEIVNTVGKQFAQPMKLKKADGKVPPLLLQRALRDRTLDAIEVYQDWASRWMANTLAGGHEHRIVRGDVLDFVSNDRSCRAWYADPPYTIDHYSRFYHVLETLCLRDSPRLDEMKKRGELSVMRGVYRVGRYQSPFCVPSQAPTAFDRLFAATAKRGSSLVLSYSPFDEEAGHRPRLLTLKEMVQTAKQHYRKVSVMEITEHSHRKLNAKSLNTGIRSDAERLIICEASS